MSVMALLTRIIIKLFYSWWGPRTVGGPYVWILARVLTIDTYLFVLQIMLCPCKLSVNLVFESILEIPIHGKFIWLSWSSWVVVIEYPTWKILYNSTPALIKLWARACLNSLVRLCFSTSFSVDKLCSKAILRHVQLITARRRGGGCFSIDRPAFRQSQYVSGKPLPLHLSTWKNQTNSTTSANPTVFTPRRFSHEHHRETANSQAPLRIMPVFFAFRLLWKPTALLQINCVSMKFILQSTEDFHVWEMALDASWLGALAEMGI